MTAANANNAGKRMKAWKGDCVREDNKSEGLQGSFQSSSEH